MLQVNQYTIYRHKIYLDITNLDRYFQSLELLPLHDISAVKYYQPKYLYIVWVLDLNNSGVMLFPRRIKQYKRMCYELRESTSSLIQFELFSSCP